MYKVTIVGEAGINWDGDFREAYELIDEIQGAGADLVKFQLYSVDSLFPDKKIIVGGKNYYDIVKKCELSFTQAKELFEYGNHVGIEVFFSVFDTTRVEWCEKIGVKTYKVGARSIKDGFLANRLREIGKPVIVSFPYGETSQVYLWGFSNWIYCIPVYPTKLKGMDLHVADFSLFRGLSEHSPYIEPAIVAVSKGAKIIEKHITLNRSLGIGPDHSSSIEPKELKELVKIVRNIEKCL